MSNLSIWHWGLFEYVSLYIDFAGMIGIIANLLNSLAIMTTRKLQNSSNAFILNLSFLDILVACLGLVVRLQVFMPKWVPGDACEAVGALTCIALATSAVNLAAIAVNRYYLVTRGPLEYRRAFSKRRTGVYILLVWVIGVIFNLPPILGFGRYGYNEKTQMCTFVYRDRRMYFHMFLGTIFGFGGVVLTVGVCYLKIYLVLRRLRRLRPGARLPRHAWTDAITTRLHQIERQDAKLVTSLFFVCCGFCVCWLPLLMTILVDYNFDAPPAAYLPGVMLLFTHPVVNPLIYLWVNKTYRQAYKKILCCRKSRCCP
ncbi:melatonin receptor type 1B-A-like [Branchiostoma floridae]|uniref:Melatonin receptor type 1B-A-like n=1 Tax=Branchiostoma floridae TaxID=7739 RepID=A0A9J7N627_BRAFL|nr:melatonin receptor type 1B-A-like [Branchiostoma floridae]